MRGGGLGLEGERWRRERYTYGGYIEGVFCCICKSGVGFMKGTRSGHTKIKKNAAYSVVGRQV